MSRLGALHITKHTGPRQRGTLIFFHGSGSSGHEMMTWVNLLFKNFNFPHIKILFPTAPLQPYTPAGRAMSNVWFDRVDISPDVPEKYDSLARIENEVKNLIKIENDNGIPSSNIVVGGFSMGGTLAYHTALRWDRNLAGAFVLSSFLNNKSIVYQELEKRPSSSLPPIIHVHGDSDELVDVKWGQKTFEELKSLGVKGSFHVIPKLGHSINRDGIVLIKEFIDKVIPYITDV